MMNTSLTNIEQALAFVELVKAASKNDTEQVLKSFSDERKALEQLTTQTLEASKKVKEDSLRIEAKEAEVESILVATKRDREDATKLLEKAKEANLALVEKKSNLEKEIYDFRAKEINLKESQDLLYTELKSVATTKKDFEKGLEEAKLLKVEYEEKLNKLRNVVG